MPQVEVFGQEVEINPLKNRALLFAGLGVVALLWITRRRAAPAAEGAAEAGPVADTGAQIEFQRLVAETEGQMAALAATNRLEERRLDLATELQRELIGAESAKVSTEAQLARERLGAEFAIAAGRQQTQRESCIPWGNFFALDNKQRDALNAQVGDGALIVVPSASGLCYRPTERGAMGSQPRVVQEIKSGLAGSRSKVTGPAGSVPTVQVPPKSGLQSALDALAAYLTATSGGGATGSGAPPDLPPGVIVA